MLKHLIFSGIFHDNDLSIHATLENPLEHGLDTTVMLFSVIVKAKNNSGITPRLEDFTFYIVDETNRFYNTQGISIPNTIEDDEQAPHFQALIHASFQHDFLYQDLRIAFCYQPRNCVDFIELRN